MPPEKELASLLEDLRLLHDAGGLPSRPSEAQVIDWAYGNAAMENSEVTREIVQAAVLARRLRGT